MMKKFMIYRAPNQVDRDLSKHELIGVEYGADIYAASDAIIRTVKGDLSENPEYTGSGVSAYAPEPMEEFRKTRRYQYYVTGVVMPAVADKNILVNYGIIEQEED